jgi:hypothetical protein
MAPYIPWRPTCHRPTHSDPAHHGSCYRASLRAALDFGASCNLDLDLVGSDGSAGAAGAAVRSAAGSAPGLVIATPVLGSGARGYLNQTKNCYRQATALTLTFAKLDSPVVVISHQLLPTCYRQATDRPPHSLLTLTLTLTLTLARCTRRPLGPGRESPRRGSRGAAGRGW